MTTTVIKTIRSSGGDYTTLSGWEAGRQAANANLVTADVIEVAECYDDWASGLADAVIISGFTTDSTHYLKVTTAPGAVESGISRSGFYLISTTSYIDILYVNNPNTVLENLHFYSTALGNYGLVISSTSSGYLVDGCIIETTGAGSSICFQISSATGIIRNCLGISNSTNGTAFNLAASSNATIYNSVAAKSSTGFKVGSGSTYPTLKNCISYSNTTNYSGTFNTASTHNATSTGSDDAPGGSSVISIASGDFVDAANNDFHITTGSALYEAGVDLSSIFTTDIDGDTWAATWSIGFDQPVGGGATNTDSAASAGSIVITGSAANGVRTLLGVASSGSIAITGSAANGAKSIAANAESGSITITGSTAAALRTLQAVATQGSVTITGVTANGVKAGAGNTDTAADSGSITITGFAANGTRTLTSAATAGSIVLTGSAASGAKTILGTADSGSITITGSDASVARTYLGVAGSGSVVITGSSAVGTKSGTTSLSAADIQAIVDALMSDPRMLTLPKWIALR